MADSGASWKTPFFALWTGQAVSLLGSSLVQFALVWWLTQSSGSATVLAGATLAAMLPQILLGPVAGVLVDRGSRRRIMLVSDSLVALTTLALAALFAFGRAQIWHVYLAMFLRSLGGAFHFAAMQTSTSLMVPREQLARVSGLNQMLNGGMNIVAPPVGALLLGLLPLQGILAIDLTTAVAGIALTAIYAETGWIGHLLKTLGVSVAYTPLGVIVALIFIGLPFVVRTVEPVLQDLDPEAEEAAASLGANRLQTFVRVIFPELLPALFTGFVLAFARALGEYGSVIFISGNMPMRTEITPLLIMIKLEQFDYAQASAIALVFLLASFSLLLLMNLLQSRHGGAAASTKGE